MALTVGELTALITADDTGVAPALRRAEGAMRASGQRMASDADDSGRQAGQQLGDGYVRGADGRLRDLRGRFVAAVRAAGGDATTAARRAGDDAGDALGDGLADSGGDGADEAGQSIGERLKGRLTMAAAGIGLAAGALLMSSMQEALDQSQITARLGAQLGTTPAVAQQYGRLAGELFKDAIVANFQEGADTIRAIAGSGMLPPGATNKQIKSIAANAADLANTFEIDVSLAAQAAGSAVKNGLAKDSKEAFDLLTRGMTGLGPAGEDLAETFREYGPIFQQAGLSGQTALGLIRQGIQGGWVQDTDKIADAFKEFALRGTEGSKAVQEAFQALGLDAKKTGDDIAAGGKRGEGAMDLVLDKLRELGPDSQEARQIISTLFGGPGEDLGAALFALDVDKATAAMGDAEGAADNLGTGLRDNAGAKVTAFKNTMQQNLVEFLGNEVIPRLEGVFKFVSEHSSVFIGAAAGVTALGTAFAVASIGVWAMNSALLANPMFWLIGGIALALVGLVMLVVAYWDEIKAATMAAWDWVVAKLVWAKDGMLAAIDWLGAIPGRVAGWFGQAKDWAVRKMTDLRDWLTGLPGRIGAAISGLSAVLTGAARTSFQRFKDGAVRKALELVAWTRGLPRQISAGIGSLGGLLFGKGQDVVRGLWRGIRGMGGWIKGQIMSWARSVIPGPVAKALGIASPSKVMAKSVGRWIPRGIVAGIESTAGEVDRTMANLVSTPTPSMSMSTSMGAAVGGGSAGGSARPMQTVRLDGGGELGDAIIALIRKRVGISGGDVQVVLGKGGR
ncbi:phage tail tape measure protein [Streptomyces sp. NPDC087512]|uniref:phage tail tape measure protein n=1 Tax=Streptomyces sp. NPDC087512 TaxID=3155059 RepID=UPI003413B373